MTQIASVHIVYNMFTMEIFRPPMSKEHTKETIDWFIYKTHYDIYFSKNSHDKNTLQESPQTNTHTQTYIYLIKQYKTYHIMHI